jgi:porin
MRCLAVALLLCAVAVADEALDKAVEAYAESGAVGSPNSTPGQLKEIAADRHRFGPYDTFLQPWFDWKAKLKENYGLDFGLNYNAIGQVVSESPGDDFAAGGIFEFLGTWTPVGRGTPNAGSLIWKIEHRHRLGTDLSPLLLGFVAGSALPTTVKFNDFGWGVTNFYWQQRFWGGKAVVNFGVLDPTDYLDIYAAINPLTSFINFQFSTNPTIPVPDQGLGIAAGAMVTNNIFFIAGLADANGDATKAGFDTFFEDREYLASVEVAWTPSFERRFFDKFSVTAWHQDARLNAGVPEGWGVVGTAEWFFRDKYLPFLRVGWGDGGAGLLKRTVAAGFAYYVSTRGLAAIGVGWADPSSGARDQYTIETFYRLQLAQNLALTPNLQFVFDPSDNPTVDLLVAFALRLRLTF